MGADGNEQVIAREQPPADVGGGPADRDRVDDGAHPDDDVRARRRWPGAVVALVLTTGFVVLALAWAGANPKGASPDAQHHVVKAYVTARGDISGEPALPETEGNAVWRQWFASVSRSYRVPAAVVPPDSIDCFAHDRTLTAACQVLAPPAAGSDVLAQSHFGTYSPALYLPIGVATLGSSDYATAEWRERLAVVVLCGLFVGWAALLLARPGWGWAPIAGLALALTPMVVFNAATVTTSGIEITSAVCLWAALLSIVREPRSRWAAPWLAAGVSGAVMALSRPVDAALLIVLIVTVLLLAGRQLRVVWDVARRPVVALVVVLAAAVVASVVWSTLVTAHPPIDVGVAVRSLRDVVRDAPVQLRQAIGVFGWNDTPMPQPVYLLSLGALVGTVAMAVRYGDRRERLALLWLAVATALVHVGLGVLVEAQIAFPMQARYTLPLLVGLPLCSGWIIGRHAPSIDVRLIRVLVVVTFVVTALVQAAGFVTNAHRYAVGGGASWRFPWDVQWTPDGGYARWFVLAAIGVVLWAAPAVFALRARSGSGDDPRDPFTAAGRRPPAAGT